MSLFNRGQKVTEVPPELQPYYDGNATRTLWVRRIVALVVLLLVIVLIVFFVRWIWHVSHHKKTTASSGITQSQTDKSKSSTNARTKSTADSAGNKATSSSPSSALPVPPVASSNSNAASNQSSNASTSTETKGNLANTGPGSTVAVFALVSAASALLYQYYLRRSATNK